MLILEDANFVDLLDLDLDLFATLGSGQRGVGLGATTG